MKRSKEEWDRLQIESDREAIRLKSIHSDHICGRIGCDEYAEGKCYKGFSYCESVKDKKVGK